MKRIKSLSLLKITLFGFLIGLFVSCSQLTNEESRTYGGVFEQEVALAEPPYIMNVISGAPVPAFSMGRKLIKEGSLRFETQDLLQTRRHIDSAVKHHQGYISSDSENKYNNRLEHTLLIRIPFQQFDPFILDVLQGGERLESKDIRTKDITEEFMDIEVRLKTKKELEQRYRELLHKAHTVTEILEVEKQIGALRSDIESIEGRLRYLQDQSQLSSITLTFYKTTPTTVAYGRRFAEGFADGWNYLVLSIIGLVRAWPFLLLLTVVGFLIRLWWQRRR